MTLALLARIQRAFYAEGQNTVEEATLADLAVEVGFDRGDFLALLTSQQAREETKADFAFACDNGVTGYPTILAAGPGALCRG